MRLLVVDDDPGVSSLLTAVFTRLGYTVESVSDGEAAVQRMRTAPCDAVLLDLMLPKRNGFEVLREVKSFNAALLPRIIVVTAASSVTLRDFDGREIFGLFRKPFDLQELVEAVAAAAQSEIIARQPAFP